MSAARDWDEWARAFESMQGPDEFAALFAPDGVFCDPVTPWTTDVRKVATDTDSIFPDWSQRVDRIRGGQDWAVFEWTGTGTVTTGSGPGVPVTMQGATVIDVNAQGKVTSWRDYLDTNEPMQQIQAGLEGAGESELSGGDSGNGHGRGPANGSNTGGGSTGTSA